MAVHEVNEKWSGDVANEADTISAVRVLQIITDDATDTTVDVESEASTHADIPERGDGHPDDSSRVLTGRKTVKKAPTLFEMSLTYEDESSGSPFDASPFSTPASERWGGVDSNEPVDRDVSGNAIVNSAFEPFGQSVQRAVTDLRLTITRNETTSANSGANPGVPVFNPAVFALSHTVNDATFYGFAAGRCLMRSPDAELVQPKAATSSWYYRVTYTIDIRYLESTAADAWKVRRLDQGFREWTSSDLTTKQPFYEPFVDEAGHPLQEPTLLNGSGGRATFAVAGTPTPAFLLFEIYGQADWSGLGL